MQKENLIQISGTVETIIYKNEETGFTVLERENLYPAPPNLFFAARKD